MRKILILFLVLCVLTGCVVAQPVATEPTAATEPMATEEVVEVAKCYFNEWILPALPKWDQDTYPYALIYQNKDSWGFYLMCLDTPFYVTTANGVQVIAFDVYAQVKAFEYWRSDPWEWKPTQYNTQPDSGAEAIYLNPEKAEYIWTNTDISDEYGTVVYPATDPVPIWEFNEKSFLIGYTLGIAGKPLPLTASQPGKEPVAYLYNGVRLPALPEWDREMYPYAYIDDEEPHSLYLLKSIEYYTNGINEFVSILSGSLVYETDWEPTPMGGVPHIPTRWEFDHTVGSRGGVKMFHHIVWANFDIVCQTDIYKPAGEIYLAASEPIPVYE